MILVFISARKIADFGLKNKSLTKDVVLVYIIFMKKILFYFVLFLSVLPLNAISLGDSLVFNVKYTFFRGKTRCRVDSVSEVNGNPVYCINYSTKISSKISIKALLFLDTTDLVPVKILTWNNTFGKKSNGKALFYQKEKLAKFYQWKGESLDSNIFRRKEKVQDVLTLPFFLMSIPFDSLDGKEFGLLQGEFKLKVVGSDTLKVNINGKKHKLPVIHVKSIPDILDAYISNDSLHLPVIVNAKQSFGSMKLSLSNFKLN